MKRDLPTANVDAQLVALTRCAGPDSAHYRHLGNALEEVGTGTLTNLRNEGALFDELDRRGYIVPLPTPSSFRQNSQRLIIESVRSATSVFMREQVLDVHWTPSDASLSDCFVSLCICTFAAKYVQFWTEEGVHA